MQNSDSTGMDFRTVTLRSKEEFEAWAQQETEVLKFRRSLEERLERELPIKGDSIYLGYCWVCGKHSHFLYDKRFLHSGHINWRECLVCNVCGLANRLRLSVHALETLVQDLSSSRVYLTEQVTPIAITLRKRVADLICSEFLGPKFTSGTTDSRGIRHEDLTSLSFADEAFDVVLSFDVFEHIPDYKKALREVRRVLRPDGYFLITVPFHRGSAENIIRATIHENGMVEHLLVPEYHGDPVNPQQGTLCYYHFGWRFLDDMKASGFADASVQLSWSSDYAYIGPEQLLIIGLA